MQEGLRLYSFQNMYLGGVQAGIQCQHATTELFVKYQHGAQRMLMNWACNHKTTILLNGGMANNLKELCDFLKEGDLHWAHFNESEEALGGCITNVCVVVPERVYCINGIPQDVDYVFYEDNYTAYGDTLLTEFEFELNKRIKSCRLMN